MRGEGAEDNVSAPSSFIPKTHNELYAFLRKATYWTNSEANIGEGAPPPLEPATEGQRNYTSTFNSS